ncbi:MAG: hypothetical protein IJK89_00910 [Clostridia bacterium]|nr:hypothetical protein [Clostridia bacterium]
MTPLVQTFCNYKFIIIRKAMEKAWKKPPALRQAADKGETQSGQNKERAERSKRPRANMFWTEAVRPKKKKLPCATEVSEKNVI